MSELALKLIDENKRSRATFLDLSNCGLTAIPEELGELWWLEELFFTNYKYHQSSNPAANQIASLSFADTRINPDNSLTDSEVQSNANAWSLLKNLRKLRLGDCFNNSSGFIDLSPLSALANLQQLDVWHKQVSDLSPLSALVNLQVLNIWRTQVSDLSPLSSLTNLRTLNVSETRVSDLSPLSSLTNLRTLNVSETRVSDLSPLSLLVNLRLLEASATHVSDLSPLSALVNLQGLNIWRTQVSDLSPLSPLVNLKELNVSETQVSDLSPLSTLVKLQWLSASDTLISDLSPLSGLVNLQQLSVSQTQVSDLLPISSLVNLQEIVVWDTQVSNLLPLLEFIKKGLPIKSERSWRWGKIEEGIYIEDCPLTNPPAEIVQQGNEAILNYFREQAVQGVDHLYEAKMLIVGEGGAGKTSLLRRLYQTDAPLPDEDETTKGIDIHQHPFKLSNGRDFRLNVWDFGGQEIYHATHQFFLTKRSLYVLLDDTRKNDSTVHDPVFKYWLDVVDLLGDHSPVLVFQNEKGGRSKAIDQAGIKSKFPSVKEFYRGDLQQADSVASLRCAVEHFAQNLPHIGEQLPAQWVVIRAEIERQAQQHATIGLQDYFNIYGKHLPFDRVKALHLSRYLHDLGVFLHFQDDPLLVRTVILQNTWATEAVFKMLDDEIVKERLGRFTIDDCQRVWQDSVYADMHPELLALMQEFKLCYRLADARPDTWLAPQLLPPSKPLILADWQQAGDLVLRYRYPFLPKGMINQLMVRLHRYVRRPDMAWTSGALFERDDTQVLAEIAPRGDEIVLRARGSERKELLSVIAADLDALNDSFRGLKDKVEKSVPCICGHCQLLTEPEFFQHRRLLQRKRDNKLTVECPTSYENVNVLELIDGVNMLTDKKLHKLFISYSKHDGQHKDNLLKHLSGLRDRIVTWHDRDLLAGEDWDERIKQELLQADVVLYLVSANSMATDYIQAVELPLIEKRCQAKQCVLIPVIVDFCLWQELDFAKYNALPEKGVPITDLKHWINENQAWLKVVEGIKHIVA
jgi:internalin A